MIDNLGSSNQQPPLSPSEIEQNPKFEKWRPLLKVQSSMITLRDPQTTKLIAFNKPFRDMFLRHNKDVPNSEGNIKSALVLNLIKENNKQISPFKTLRCKNLLRFYQDYCVLLDAIMHFDDSEIWWSELREVDPPIWDDSFEMGDYKHAATVHVELPVHNVEDAK